MNKFFGIITATSLISGCASITTGTTQNLKILTGKETGASCTLSNDKGNWTIDDTPQTINVKRSYDDLSILCKKGCKSGNQTVKSSTKGMVAGNIIFGGLIGGGIDCASGAAYDYPSEVNVILK